MAPSAYSTKGYACPLHHWRAPSRTSRKSNSKYLEGYLFLILWMWYSVPCCLAGLTVVYFKVAYTGTWDFRPMGLNLTKPFFCFCWWNDVQSPVGSHVPEFGTALMCTDSKASLSLSPTTPFCENTAWRFHARFTINPITFYSKPWFSPKLYPTIQLVFSTSVF